MKRDKSAASRTVRTYSAPGADTFQGSSFFGTLLLHYRNNYRLVGKLGRNNWCTDALYINYTVLKIYWVALCKRKNMYHHGFYALRHGQRNHQQYPFIRLPIFFIYLYLRPRLLFVESKAMATLPFSHPTPQPHTTRSIDLSFTWSR